MKALEIEMLNLSDLKEYENNAKEHTEQQIQQIVNSIRDFGFNDPIAVDENNVIIEGHGRLYAASRLEMEQVPCIRLTHMNEQEKKAYVLAHNKLTMVTGFDFDMLQQEIAKIELDMSNYGFASMSDIDEQELEELFEEVEPKEQKPKVVKCPHCGGEVLV